MESQVCVYGLQVVRRISAARARAFSLLRPDNLLSLWTPIESYEWLRTRTPAVKSVGVKMVKSQYV